MESMTKVVTDSPEVEGNMISSPDLGLLHSPHDTIHLHIHHEETFKNYASRLAILLQHKVILHIKTEIIEAFNRFIIQFQERYPILFCRKYNIIAIE